jgi:hypothetical protein
MTEEPIIGRALRNIQRATDPKNAAWLRAQLPLASLPGTGVVGCQCDGAGRFVPLGLEDDPPGRPMVVTADAYGEEATAFHPADPGRWWVLGAGVALLGADVADKARVSDGRVRVFETPWSWLRAGRSGVVVIDWSVLTPADLDGLSLDPETGRLGARLRAALVARLPRVDGRAA